MIIYRYLSRQLFWATIAVSSILTFILVSSRFLKYLSQAAVGKLEGGAVFMIMAYRLPDFLELILPLGLFLGILLSYGRMYLENEMVVLQACGVSQRRLVALSLIPAICMSLLIGYFAFFLSPWGAQKANNLIFEQQTRSGLDVLSPRRFHSTRDGSTVTYVEDIDSRAGVMKNLFIVNYDRENVGDEYSKVILMRATEGTYRIDDKGNRYLVMSNGVRFEVDPGSSVFAQTRYGEYTIKLEEKLVSQGAAEFQDRTTEDLLGDDSISARVELQWRLSLMIMVPIVVFIAVPLSRANPRQGRYLKMLPAILIYLAYLASMMSVKGGIEKGRIPAELGLYWVHVLFFGLGFLLNYWPSLRLKMSKKRMDRLEASAP
ncbi:LPS export ABC transporter permease LptF [Ketobacter sp. MCCC 1A13808]|uniref:LPS export ABC transporter permease LptF n=1 Tax=Ketobacter sp. MCCC 1A13808 TaxID=2602738 RepID=UPI000F1E162E|nr:LPS export ABC transporter permease LptF [Ketobacter sp. MCCC 1A13808]MVF14562.1 LPS export ABC transporter permease LptF [Ketobacter sp. MCCC 1A13808]RLP54172.1 MAG: LPS export ABC transporter permease LptF [Ketobacter sp.]